MMKSAFSRSIALASAMAAMMSGGLSYAAAAAQSGASSYRSRGKGRGTAARSFGSRRRGQVYPFSSTKQDNKHATRQITVMRNGFPIMNTLKAKDRLSMSQVG